MGSIASNPWHINMYLSIKQRNYILDVYNPMKPADQYTIKMSKHPKVTYYVRFGYSGNKITMSNFW